MDRWRDSERCFRSAASVLPESVAFGFKPERRSMRRRSHHRRWSYRGEAFTLIELLVVVVIATILVGLLMPALASARRQAQAIVCMSNLKSVGFDFNLTLENPGSLKRLNQDANDRTFGLTSFIDKLYGAGAYYPDHHKAEIEHINGDSIFFCPSGPEAIRVNRLNPFPEQAAAALAGAVAPLQQLSYGFNARLHKVFRGPSPQQSGSTRWYPSLSKSLLDNAGVGRTVLLADYDGELAQQAAGNVDPHLFAPAVERFGHYRASVHKPLGEQWFPKYRHNGKCNVALLDGSVISAPEETLLGSPQRINWADAQYDGFWRGGIYYGTGTLSDTGLFSHESLTSTPVY